MSFPSTTRSAPGPERPAPPVRTARTRGRSVAALLAVGLGASLVVLPQATAAPAGDDVTAADVDAARSAEQVTAGRIAELEVQLAQVAAAAEEARVSAALANEAYLAAQDELAAAEQRADEARGRADESAAELDRARDDIAGLAQEAYRSGSRSMAPAAPYLSPESFEQAMQRTEMTEVLGDRADRRVQSFEAVQQVATTLSVVADEAEAEASDAAGAAESAADAAGAAAEAAGAAVASAAAQRGALIDQLAHERNTTVELETQRQQ